MSTDTHVFLSYSRADHDRVVWLEKELSAFGYVVDFDLSNSDPDRVQTGISAEDEWWKRLEEMIAASDVVVFLVSSSSIQSTVCDDEIAFARSLGKRIIPVLVRLIDLSKAPPRLSALNIAIDFCDPSEADLSILHRAIDVDVKWLREGRKWAQRATEWVQKERDPSFLLRDRAIADAEEWLGRRKQDVKAPNALLFEFFAESRRAQSSNRERLRLNLGRAFVQPIKNALENNEPDRAFRMMAAAAISTEDPHFELVPELWRSGAKSIAQNPEYALSVDIEEDPDDHYTHGPVVSPDGQRVLTRPRRQSVNVYEVSTGLKLSDFQFEAKIAYAEFIKESDVALITEAGDVYFCPYSGSAPQNIFTFPNPDTLRCVHFEPGHRSLLYFQNNKILRLDLEAKEVSVVAECPHTPWVLCSHKKSGLVVSISGDDDKAYISRSGRTELIDPGHGIYFCAISGDGAVVGFAGVNDVSFVSSAGGDLLSRVANKGRPSLIGDAIHCLSLNHDGTLALTGAADSTARLWDTTAGEELLRMDHGEEAIITEAAFARDERAIVTNGTDCTVRMWETENGREFFKLANYHGGTELPMNFRGFSSIDCGKSKSELITTNNGLVQVWRPPEILDHSSAIAISTDYQDPTSIRSIVPMKYPGMVGLLTGSKSLVFYDVAKQKKIRHHRFLDQPIRCIQDRKTGDIYSYSSYALFAYQSSNRFLGWEHRSSDSIHDINLTTDGQHLVIATGEIPSGPGTITILSTSGELIFTAPMDSWATTGCANIQEKRVWGADIDGTLFEWSLDGVCVRRDVFADCTIDQLVLQGSSLLIATTEQLLVCDTTNNVMRQLCKTNGSCRRLSVLRDSKIAAIEFDDHIEFVDLEIGAELLNIRLDGDIQRPENFESCALTSCGDYVFGATNLGRLISIRTSEWRRFADCKPKTILDQLRHGNDLPRGSEKFDLLMSSHGEGLLKGFEEFLVSHDFHSPR